MDKIKEQLQKYVQELYDSHDRFLNPLYPGVVVQVLPKEHKSAGGIILPQGTLDGKSANKPVAEAVVLATWKPFYKHFRTKKIDGKTEVTEVYMEPTVKPGDVVLIPHWEGLPIPWLDEKMYRVIKETEIRGIIEYDKKVKECLHEMFEQVRFYDLENRILDKFYVIPKDLASRTTSGV